METSTNLGKLALPARKRALHCQPDIRAVTFSSIQLKASLPKGFRPKEWHPWIFPDSIFYGNLSGSLLYPMFSLRRRTLQDLSSPMICKDLFLCPEIEQHASTVALIHPASLTISKQSSTNSMWDIIGPLPLAALYAYSKLCWTA